MRVLAVGAHPDDIELGCGATLLTHQARGDEVTLLVMTTGEQGPQDARSRIGEQEDAAAVLGASLIWGGFEDGNVPEGRDAITVVQHAIARRGPDLIYTHTPRDTHQDHRATAAAVLSAARRMRQVLLYESPTSIQFAPSIFVDVAAFIEDKMDLVRAHMSQVLKNGLVDLEALEAQARYHGFRARLHYAEAFETDRFLWDLAPLPQPRASDHVALQEPAPPPLHAPLGEADVPVP
jgi:LmbE family N-acetylglucosaminyl deacetylase